MDREQIIRMVREVADKDKVDPYLNEFVVLTPEELERFAALVAAAERNKLAAWMIKHSYATWHGDTVEDLLKELEWQIAEREREACAKAVEDYCGAWDDEGYALATAIRSRGEK